jgi:hypothetical protein
VAWVGSEGGQDSPRSLLVLHMSPAPSSDCGACKGSVAIYEVPSVATSFVLGPYVLGILEMLHSSIEQRSANCY